MTDNMGDNERERDAARDADVSSGAPDAVASDGMASEGGGHGTADTVNGALTPGSTATSSPTSSD